MSVTLFVGLCPVRPFQLPSRRWVYDTHELNDWLVTFKNGQADADILARLA